MLDPHDVCAFESNASQKLRLMFKFSFPHKKKTHDWTKHLSIHKTYQNFWFAAEHPHISPFPIFHAGGIQ